MEMKKYKIFNDLRSLFISLFFLAGFTFFMTISLRYTTGFTPHILSILLWGSFIVMGIYLLFSSFEIILFCDEKIVSFQLFKRVEIFYNEITGIEEVEKESKGANSGGFEPVWHITSSTEQKEIFMIKYKSRIKIIDQLKLKCNIE